MIPLFITALLDRVSMPLPTGASCIVAASLGALDASAMSPPLLPPELPLLVLLPPLLEVLPLVLLPPPLEVLPLALLPPLLDVLPLVLLPLLLALVPPLLAAAPTGKFVLSDPQPLEAYAISAKREPRMTERLWALGIGELSGGLKARHRTAREPAGTHHRQLGWRRRGTSEEICTLTAATTLDCEPASTSLIPP